MAEDHNLTNQTGTAADGTGTAVNGVGSSHDPRTAPDENAQTLTTR